MSEQQQQTPVSNPGPSAGYHPGPHQGVRQVTRLPGEGMIAGVCAGLARYAGLDPTLVRVLAVVGLVVGFPAVFVGYLVAWAIMPRG